MELLSAMRLTLRPFVHGSMYDISEFAADRRSMLVLLRARVVQGVRLGVGKGSCGNPSGQRCGVECRTEGAHSATSIELRRDPPQTITELPGMRYGSRS